VTPPESGSPPLSSSYGHTYYNISSVVVRISSEDDSAEVGILPISTISHSLKQRRLDQRRNEEARQPEERKNSECPRRWMNIGSVEGTGVFKKKCFERA
jgi:hypothetical protein